MCGTPHTGADSYWGDLMAASGELWWPSAGRSVSAYGENLMAADTAPAEPSAHLLVSGGRRSRLAYAELMLAPMRRGQSRGTSRHTPMRRACGYASPYAMS